MTVSEKHTAAARDVFRSYLRRIEYDRRACFEHDELMQEMIAAALAAAERDGMRRAVRIIREGYPRLVAVPYRRDGKPSNHDKCAHHFYMIEDCEECAIAAILSEAGEA